MLVMHLTGKVIILKTSKTENALLAALSFAWAGHGERLKSRPYNQLTKVLPM